MDAAPLMGRSALVGATDNAHDERMEPNTHEQGERESAAGELRELDADQILQMLQSHTLGRMVFAHENWPVIVPVNYAFEDPTVVIRTGPGAKLASAPFHAIAFEIDDADPSGSWGWSVLVQGTAFEITNARDEHSRHLRDLVAHPAAPGVRDHWMAISALRISGRSFGDPPELQPRSVDGEHPDSPSKLGNLC